MTPRDRWGRIVLATAVVVLAGCGAGERPAPPIAPAAAPTTRAAGSAFERSCLREAGSVTIAVLCPARLPLGGFEAPRNYGDGPCTYLLNLEPRGMLRRAGAVFHVLVGGTCRPWSLRTRAGRWPADAAAVTADERDLRLVGTTSLVPGQTDADRVRVGLRVLRRTRIRSAPALVLRNPPYPVGGIHGGHLSVVWNTGGAGYVVSGHAVASRERPDAAPGPEALGRAALTLLRVAASMRPAEPETG